MESIMKKLSLLAFASIALIGGSTISAYAHESHTEIKKNLVLNNSASLSALNIEAGAGSLKVFGDATITDIQVEAMVSAESENDYTLELTQRNGVAKLEAKTESRHYRTNNTYINLTVRVPSHLLVKIDDGSGDIVVKDIFNSVKINDGSGSINLSSVTGSVVINDGSGDITLNNVGDMIDINDGSGSIDIQEAGGNISINDGSGDINAKSVAGNIDANDASGSVTFKKVQGDIKLDDSSGDIVISNTQGHVTLSDSSGSISVSDTKGLTIKRDTSGGVYTDNIDGPISLPRKQ